MRATIRAVRRRFVLAMGADGEPDDLAIARLMLAEEGITDPSPEVLSSLSPEAIARKRDKLTAEAAAEVERKRARSPEGRVKQARADQQARAERAELVALAAEQTGWTEADVEEMGETRLLQAAGFEETPFEEMSLEGQRDWLNEHPQEAEQMFAEEEVKLLAGRWSGMTLDERASAAAHAGAGSIAEVEAELTRRGQDDFVPIAGHAAAEAIFAREAEAVRGGESDGGEG